MCYYDPTTYSRILSEPFTLLDAKTTILPYECCDLLFVSAVNQILRISINSNMQYQITATKLKTFILI